MPVRRRAITHVRSQAAAIQGEPSPGGVPAPARMGAHPRRGLDLRPGPHARHPRRALPIQDPRDLGRQRAHRRAGDPRAEPLLEHGPLLRRRLHPAQDQVHGQVPDVRPQRAPRLHLPGRRGVPRDARPPRRGHLHHRPLDPRPRRLRRSCTRRADAPAPAASASRRPASAGWRSSPGSPSSRSRSTDHAAYAAGSASRFPRSPSSTAIRWPSTSSSIRPVSSSTRPPRRSSIGSRRCTAPSTSAAGRA